MQIPKHVQEGKVILSPSRVGGAMRCMRKHLINDTLSWVQAGARNPYQEFGTRMHRMASLWWTEGDAAICSEYLRAQEWPLNEKHTLDLALRLLAAYTTQARKMPFAADGEEWEFETVEQRIVLELADDLALSFQIDRLLRRDEHRALVDTKSASRCDARWAKQWPRSLQMKLYAEAVSREYHCELDWLIIEGLDKTAGKVSLVSLPDFSKDVRTEAMRNFEWVAKHDMQIIESSKLPDGTIDVDKLFDRVLTQSPFNESECFSYNSECDYLRLCNAEPEERKSLLIEGYEYVEPEYAE